MDNAHKHAVTKHNGVTQFVYDQNGNMTQRYDNLMQYDVENRLTSVVKGGVTTSFAYNGDGTRVKRSVSNAGTTYYVGNLYEYTTWTGGSSVSKYYYFGGQRVAVKQDINVSYIHGDHPSILRDKSWAARARNRAQQAAHKPIFLLP